MSHVHGPFHRDTLYLLTGMLQCNTSRYNVQDDVTKNVDDVDDDAEDDNNDVIDDVNRRASDDIAMTQVKYLNAVVCTTSLLTFKHCQSH